jgi:hypothetical protein
MATPERDAKDRAALKYAGQLGHTVVIVVDDMRSNIGLRYVTAELSDVGRARLMVRNDYADRRPQIWARDARGRWQKRQTP